MRFLVWCSILSACLLASSCSHPVEPETPGTPSAGSYRVGSYEFAMGDTAETVHGAAVGSTFFQEAKIRPLLGRTILPGEFQMTKPAVAVIADSLWRRKFGADPSIIGKVAQLNKQTFVIVGVMPKTFKIPENAEVWFPEAAAGK